MPSSILLRALGLTTSPNELMQPDGSLSDATNVVIRRDNIIEPRRGFHLYGTSFGTSTDTGKQLLSYQKTLLRHYNNTLSYDSDGAGTWTDFAGTYTEPTTGRRIRSIESNGNFYFTTSTGIKKISATSSSQFTNSSGYITQAGGIKAVDIQTRLKIAPGVQTSFFTQDSTVGYRALWATNDENGNLVRGTPSQYNQIYNPLFPLLVYDFNRAIGMLDDMGQGVSSNTDASGTMIDNENYMSTLVDPTTSLPMTANSASTSMRTNLIALASKLDGDIIYADQAGTKQLTISAAAISSGVCTITFSAGNPTNFWSTGGNIYLNNFAVSGGNAGAINGAQVIASVTSTTITFTTTSTATTITVTGATITSNEYRSLKDSGGNLYNAIPVTSIPPTNGQLTYMQGYLQAILTRLSSEPTRVISSTLQTKFVSQMALTTTATVVLDVTIPSAVNSNYFLQIYRSPIAQASSTQVLTRDVFSTDELQLVYEAYPTTAQLAAGIVEVEDITLPFFAGANLYTNPYSGEGPTQANDIPPAAQDVNVFKNTLFYANTRTRHRLSLNLLGVVNMISDYGNGTTPNVVITNGTAQNTYTFVTGVAQVATVTTVADVANSLSGKYFTINGPSNYDQYYVWYKTSGGTNTDPAVSGRTGIPVYINTGDSASTVATKTFNTLNRYTFDFSVTVSTSTLTITNISSGYTTAPAAGTSGFTVSTATSGRGELVAAESIAFTLPAGSTFTASGSGNYFTLNPPFNYNPYYVWFQVGSSVDPAITGRTGIQVTILNTDTAAQVVTKAAAAINAAASSKFTASANSTTLTVTNVNFGPAANPTASMPGGYSFSVSQTGALQVILSSQVSPATAVDETARSLVRVINRNKLDIAYAYYLSSVQGVPGEMNIEARILDQNPIYVLGNNANTGASFSPNIAPTNTITGISVANPTVVTSASHGLTNGSQIVITGSNSIPPIDGTYTVSNVTTNTFTVPVNVAVSGTAGSFILASAANVSSNEVKSNRIYYAKNLEPDAVPIVNFFDVGAVNKAILRIFPLRDSLFVFKEDGLWRVSGETAPYNVALFDSSFIVLAPDSLDVSNNVIYAWTTQGLATATEAGTKTISRPIDTIILKLQSHSYNPNFSTVTWGIGYESDNSYTVYTAANQTDTKATIGFRYSNLTNTWTTIGKSNTCGIINPADDKMYLGAGDTNYIEQERKNFDRTDYADREVALTITSGTLSNNNTQLQLGTVTGVNVGDVLTQTQYLTIYEFNQLLRKLDTDPNLTLKNYYSTLARSTGADMTLALYNPLTVSGLAVQLDNEPAIVTHNYVSTVQSYSGSITSNSAASSTVITTSAPHNLISNRIVTISGVSGSTPSINGTYQITVLSPTTFSIPVNVTVAGTGGSYVTVNNDFRDQQACFAGICANLDSDAGTAFKNYHSLGTTSIEETVITAINTGTRTVTLATAIPLIVGPITIYNAINATFTYAPNTFDAPIGQVKLYHPQAVGDPLSLKHLREATIMFDNQTFTTATISFSSDLFPNFVDVPITGSGSGIFGNNPFGTAGLFGGLGLSVPFRTYIPLQCQRCRYIIVKFTHSIAREKFSIIGVTITGEIAQSSRAYR